MGQIVKHKRREEERRIYLAVTQGIQWRVKHWEQNLKSKTLRAKLWEQNLKKWRQIGEKTNNCLSIEVQGKQLAREGENEKPEKKKDNEESF